MLPVIELFHSIQGEGIYAGVPTFFIRVSGCNLRCCFKNSICDTPYASYNPEKSLYKSEDELFKAVMELIKAHPFTSHLCITGGEPLLYRDELNKFLVKIDEATDYKFIVTIETNGTLPPLNRDRVSLYSISPKLSTSVGDANGKLTKEQVEHHDKTRINLANLAKLISTEADFQLKFVYSGEECLQEIKDLEVKLYDYMKANDMPGVDKIGNSLRTMLMPEGMTVDQLKKNRKECVEACIKYGFSYTDRLQILTWGDKRGV